MGWSRWKVKEGLFFRSGFSGSAAGVVWMPELSRKMRCGIFGKSRNVRSSRVPEIFFVKVWGKSFSEIVLGKIW